jgi:putative OPT family oligopeptide transporter
MSGEVVNKPETARAAPPARYRETTVSAVVFGLVFGALMNMAITYTGLKIGFTIIGGAIAAVVAFGVLRGLLGRGSIVEVNIAETIATAVNVPNAGIIFTVPVLFLLGRSPGPGQFWLLTLAGAVGATLGVAFIVPLRKQMLDIDRLRFPSGTAVAAILKSPGAGPRKAQVLVLGTVVAMLIYLPAGLPNIRVDGQPLWGYGDLNRWLPWPILTKETVDVGRAVGLPPYVALIFAITPLAFGAGYLTGRAGLTVLAGGILAAFVLNPAARWFGWLPAALPPGEVPDTMRVLINRPLGIGMLLGGALLGVLVTLPAMRAALKSLGTAGRLRHGSDELPLKGLAVAVAVCVVLLYLAAELLGGEAPPAGLLAGLYPHLRHLIIAVVGAAWIWFAGIIIAQCTGMTDWSPISGMALLTVVLVLALAGPAEVLLAVLFGAALCVAASESADMMADLKTGYLVGGRPRRQQLLTLFTAWLGPVIAMLTLWLIVETNLKTTGKPIGPGTDTVAPQAQALQAVITGAQGGEAGSDMPYALYLFGAVLGVLLGLAAFPGLGVLVGLSMYLPITYVLTYGLGCLANMAVSLLKGKVWAEEWGVPFCAGLIVGEAFLAMLINGIILLGGSS